MQFSPDPDPLQLPERYRLAVTGSDMAPAYPEGSIVTAARDVPVEALDVVVVWYRPEAQPHPGGPLLRRLVMLPPGMRFPCEVHPASEVIPLLGLVSETDPERMLTVPCTSIAAVHPVVAVSHPAPLSPALQ